MKVNDFDLSPNKPKGAKLEQMSQMDLMVLYTKVQSLLQGVSLESMNIEQELLIQYHTLKDLLATILIDEETPANQKAQVANAITTILQSLVKTQTEVYNAERVKRMEFALIETFKNLPTEIKDDFFERYQRALEGGIA